MPGHPAGVLAIRHTIECQVYAREDATRAADQTRWLNGHTRRPATPAERDLLAALGHTGQPDDLETAIIGRGGGYGRTWPALGL